MCNFTHSVKFYTQCVILHTVWWFTLFRREAIFVANLRTFECKIFQTLKYASVKKWQISGMVVWLMVVTGVFSGPSHRPQLSQSALPGWQPASPSPWGWPIEMTNFHWWLMGFNLIILIQKSPWKLRHVCNSIIHYHWEMIEKFFFSKKEGSNQVLVKT